MQEISIQKHGNDSILVQIPGATNREDIKKILSQTGSLKFHMIDMNVSGKDIEENVVPLGSKILPMIVDNGKVVKVAVNLHLVMSGVVIADSHTGSNMGRYVVNFKLTDTGTKNFVNLHNNNVCQVMSFVFEEKCINIFFIKKTEKANLGFFF